MAGKRIIAVVGCHAEGEQGDVITGGVLPPAGDTMMGSDLKRGDILFYRETELPPGRYIVNTVAYDAATAGISAYSSSIDVPTADETKLRLSSVVIINRVERLGASDQNLKSPLRFGEVLIYPNTGEPLRKSTSKQLALYFTTYPSAGSTAAPRLAIDVLQNGKPLAHTAGSLPAADATGAIQYASALPLDALQPGDYELKITVNDGRSSATRSAHFSVAL